MSSTDRRMCSAVHVLAAAVLMAGALVACSAGSKNSSAGTKGVRASGSAPVTITVPGDAPSISAAVAATKPGDLVLVSPGLYEEMVRITTPGVTLRGTDRGRVVIDGGVLRPNGIVVTAADVTVQNLTVRNTTLNGVLFTGMSDGSGGLAKGSDGYQTLDPSKFPPLAGFRADHVTSYNNGLYGIYAFDTTDGVIENSYTSGMADSGIYVGQCKPCRIVVRGNVAERNAVGYEGTNASTQMTVTGNRFVGNRVGATTDSDHQEAFVPQAGSTIVGNVVAANDQQATPEQADGGFGIGLGIAGGTRNVYARNLIQRNSTAGMIITSADDLAPKGNQVLGNRFSNNGVDVAYTATAAAPGSGNCLSGNTLASTLPAALAASTCPGSSAASVGATLSPGARAPAGIAFTDVAPPPSGLPSLQPPTSPPAAWSPASVPAIDVAAVGLPSPALLAGQSSIRW